MAVGEAACVSVHGANRLGSNSLIDLVVFGRAARPARRRDRRRRARRQRRAADATRPTWPSRPLDRLRNANGGTPTAELRAAHAARDAGRRGGVPHRRGRWREAPKRIARGLARARPTSRSPTARMIWNSDLIETLEFDNLIGQAVVTVDGAPQPRRRAAARMRARTSRTATTRTG